MKKVLYTTTALAAVGLLALAPSDAMAQKKKAKVAAPKLSLGGYMKHHIGWADQDGSFETQTSQGYNTFNHVVDSEIYFSSRTKLDNGITISSFVALETDQSNNVGQGIDDAFITISGAFGTIQAGNTRRAGWWQKAKHGGAHPAAGLLINGNPNQWDFIVRPAANAMASNAIGGSGNAQGTSNGQGYNYYTPRFMGFQAAIGWAPDFLEADVIKASGLSGGAAQSQLDYSLSYSGKFSDVNVKATVGFWNMMGRAGNSDESTWRVGGNIAYAGFDIGGEIGETDDNTEKVLTATTETSADKDLWSVGVRYKTGPWTIAANYIESESEGLTSDVDEDEFQQYGVQATYNLSKGIDLGFTLNHVEFDDESRNNGAAGDAANSNEGWYVSTGLRLTF